LLILFWNQPEWEVLSTKNYSGWWFNVTEMGI
jgi:hypothetical protein